MARPAAASVGPPAVEASGVPGVLQVEQLLPPPTTTEAGTRYTWPEKRAATTPPHGRGCTCLTEADPSGTGGSQHSTQPSAGQFSLFPPPAQAAQHGFSLPSSLAVSDSSASGDGSHSVRRVPLLRPNTGRSPTRVTELTGSQVESLVGKIALPRRIAASTARRRHSGHTGTDVTGIAVSLLTLEPRGRLQARCDRKEGVRVWPGAPAPPSARGLPPHMAGQTGLHLDEIGSNIEQVQASAAMSRARKKGERRTAVELSCSAAEAATELPARCACGSGPEAPSPGGCASKRPVASPTLASKPLARLRAWHNAGPL